MKKRKKIILRVSLKGKKSDIIIENYLKKVKQEEEEEALKELCKEYEEHKEMMELPSHLFDF
jgi:hypothetical protein